MSTTSYRHQVLTTVAEMASRLRLHELQQAGGDPATMQAEADAFGRAWVATHAETIMQKVVAAVIPEDAAPSGEALH